MDKKVANQINTLCNSIEILIKENIKDEHNFGRQKVLVELFTSVLNYQLNYKRD